VLAGLFCALAVIKLATERGEVVIETDDPDVEVVVKGQRVVRIVDPKTKKAYVLDRHDLTLALADDPDGLRVTLDGDRPVVLRRKGRQIAAVRLAAASGPLKTYEVKDVPVQFLTSPGDRSTRCCPPAGPAGPRGAVCGTLSRPDRRCSSGAEVQGPARGKAAPGAAAGLAWSADRVMLTLDCRKELESVFHGRFRTPADAESARQALPMPVRSGRRC
jgi:hypothetical protein